MTRPGASSTVSEPDAVPAGQPVPAAGRPPGRPRRRRSRTTASAAATVVLLLALFGLLELGVVLGAFPSGLPRPSVVVVATGSLLADPVFWGDLGRSAVEVLASIVIGAVVGLLAGIAFWKVPLLGRVFEPYLVSFYAVPLVLFYPMMIVLVGINVASVVILASVMAAIPMALNTATGLSEIRPVFLRLARVLRCTRWQTLVSLALPAAAPLIVAGLRLASVYALIGAIAMEFTTAQAGLGYRIRYLYETFDNVTMFAYIFVVLVLSVLLTVGLAVVEKAMLKGRA